MLNLKTPAIILLAISLNACGGSSDPDSTEGPEVTYNVSTDFNLGGSLHPEFRQVSSGSSTSFEVNTDSNAELIAISGCAGNLSGTTYTTGAITADCTVSATFETKTFTVQTVIKGSGSISPASQTVQESESASFELNPDEYAELVDISGCEGSLSGSTYTTSAITADCTVAATFELPSYTVQTVVSGNGTVYPTSLTIEHGKTGSFELIPDAKHSMESVVGCDGYLVNDSYTTTELKSNCTIEIAFNKPENLTMLFRHHYFTDKGKESVPFNIPDSEFLVDGDELGLAPQFYEYSYGRLLIEPVYEELTPLEHPSNHYTIENFEYPVDAFLWDTLLSTALIPEFPNYDLIVAAMPYIYTGEPGCIAFKEPIKIGYGSEGKSHDIKFAALSGTDFSCYDRRSFAHEVGHTFNLGHSSSIFCDLPERPVPVNLFEPTYCGDDVESIYYAYGDGHGVQGSYRGHPNLFWKLRAGWIDEKQIHVVGGSEEVYIDAYEPRTLGYKGAQIPLSEVQSTENPDELISYWLEYRTQTIYDQETYEVWRDPNEIQIRLNIPKLTDQFDQLQTDMTLFYEGDQRITQMRLVEHGDVFHDVYQGVRVTWLDTILIGDLKQAKVYVERSDIELSSQVINSAHVIEFKNQTNDPVQISDLDLVGRNSDSFVIIDDECVGVLLEPGANCSVSLEKLTQVQQHAVMIFENDSTLRPRAALSLSTL